MSEAASAGLIRRGPAAATARGSAASDIAAIAPGETRDGDGFEPELAKPPASVHEFLGADMYVRRRQTVRKGERQAAALRRLDADGLGRWDGQDVAGVHVADPDSIFWKVARPKATGWTAGSEKPALWTVMETLLFTRPEHASKTPDKGIIGRLKHALLRRDPIAARRRRYERLARDPHTHAGPSRRLDEAELAALHVNAFDFGRSRNILFAVHWFELGGAEGFAAYMMSRLKAAGKTIVAVSTEKSPNDFADRFAAHSDELISLPDWLPPDLWLGFLFS